MTALSQDAKNLSAHANSLELLREAYAGKTGVTFYQGAAVGRDPADSSLVKPATAAKPLYEIIGVNGAYLAGDGTKKVKASTGLFERENSAGSDEVLSTLPLGWPLYAVDDATVSLTNGGGTRAFLGVFGGMSGNGKPLVWIGMDPIGLMARGITIPLVKGHADLTAAAVSETFELYTLPGPCRVASFGVIDTLTVFSGGGSAAATLAFGIDTGSDVDAIGNETDIFTGAAAAPKALGAGVLGFYGAPISKGVKITATFASDVNVVLLTAGAVVAYVTLIPGC